MALHYWCWIRFVTCNADCFVFVIFVFMLVGIVIVIQFS